MGIASPLSRKRLRAVLSALLAVCAAAAPSPAGAGTWLLQNGEEYYGDLESYSFRTKEVVLRKADGKSFAFPARDLAFGAKSKLIASRAFLRALPGYRPPLLPVLAFLALAGAAFLAPLGIGLVGSCHVFGTDASLLVHARGFLKLAGLCLLLGAAWLAASVLLDPGIPVLPDTNADLVLGLTTLNCGIFFCSLLISLHYRRSFWKGMAITLLTGVFCAILWTAGGLLLLFVVTRRDVESVVTRFVFEPFQWF